MRTIVTGAAEALGVTLIAVWAELAFDAGLLVAGSALLFAGVRWSR